MRSRNRRKSRKLMEECEEVVADECKSNKHRRKSSRKILKKFKSIIAEMPRGIRRKNLKEDQVP